jgi:HlyD family secretion protein
MKTWIIILILAGCSVGGFYGWNKWKKTHTDAPAAGRPTTAVAEVRDINFAVNAAGEISPAEQVSVRPEINGLIETMKVDLGDLVKKDELLFKLDDRELQQQRASNLTDVERARLDLEKAERDYHRAERLLADKLISQEIFDDSKTTYDLARNAVERAKRELGIIEERLTKMIVRAPFDCTILTRPVSVGQAVSGSGGFNSGTEVLTIADLNSMIINAQVNQADVPRLRPGQTVDVSVEAVPGLHVNGSIERIAPQATIKNNIKGFAARIVLKNVDARIRPGMTANVKIPVASAENVTAVPLAAVYTEKNDAGIVERFVYVQAGEKGEKRTVKVGVSDFFYAEIQEGLNPGEVVCLEMPKEEQEKKQKAIVAQKKANPEGHSPNSRTNAPGTNSAATASQSSGHSTDSGSAGTASSPTTATASPATSTTR